MPYTANIYRVFIASPGDVPEEREMIRSIVWDWNSINASSRKIFLEPVGWETHSFPEMGDRPQAIINKQILNEADLLVAVFWTRLGTATGFHRSGTAEEIEEHLAAGKPAMIYFSDTSVRPDSVDDAQFVALREFRQHLQERGLVESYSGLSEFTQKFTRQLQRTLNDTSRFSKPSSLTDTSVEVAAVPQQSLIISDDALELLIAAVNSDGRIMTIRHMGGYHIQVGNGSIIDTSTPRLSAKWRSAIDELYQATYIRDIAHKGEIFEVTENGYKICEGLQVRGPEVA